MLLSHLYVKSQGVKEWDTFIEVCYAFSHVFLLAPTKIIVTA